MALRVLDLFSGIGGFSLGFERTGGFQTVAFCEIDPFCRRVLQKHWPNVRQYEDVQKLTADKLVADGIAVDVITGGFPCQDISTAGRQAGIADGTRSGLWSEIARLARELRPRFIIVENVANLLAGPPDKRGGWFGRVLGDLAALGYDAEWHSISASDLGACHKRERIWIVAHSGEIRSGGLQRQLEQLGPLGQRRAHHAEDCQFTIADATSVRQSESRQHEESISLAAFEHRQANQPVDVLGWPTEPAIRRTNDGVSRRMDVARLSALGNAVVPQIPEIIGRAILESLNEKA
jgi:DNA (cytosine-5)-methyltransferase 1